MQNLIICSQWFENLCEFETKSKKKNYHLIIDICIYQVY